jgi:hypothetical protein
VRRASAYPHASQADFILKHGRAYVEGYSINMWVTGHPVAHAWCIDPEGFAVDTTWKEGTEYFGVPFRAEYVRRICGPACPAHGED